MANIDFILLRSENLLLLESPNSSMANDETQINHTEPVLSTSESKVQQSDVDKLLAFSPPGDQSSGPAATTTSNEVEEEIFIDVKLPADTNEPKVPPVRPYLNLLLFIEAKLSLSKAVHYTNITVRNFVSPV